MNSIQPGPRLLFVAWVIVFLVLSFLLWISIRFWGMRIRIAPPISAVAPANPVVRVVPPPGNAPILSLQEILETGKRTKFIGRAVRFEATVEGRAGPGFWVGDGNGKLLYMMPPRSFGEPLRKGRKVVLSGLIINTPSPSVIYKDWHVIRNLADRIASERIYLHAATIEIR